MKGGTLVQGALYGDVSVMLFHDTIDGSKTQDLYLSRLLLW